MGEYKSKNPHRGHRQRLKGRYVETQGQSFNIHELIELLLFYSIPRANTNEIAHSLVERFGSINNMIEADIDELKLVHGVGDESAVLLKLVLSLAKEYAEEKRKLPSRLDCISKAVEYANQHTIGAIKELVFAIFMDENFNIIDTNLVASGTINEARPTLRNVLELCVLKRATRMILFHNHPSGDCEPSVEDIDMTIMLKRELEIIGVTLVEHLIVDGRGGYCALVERIYDKKNDYYQ